VSEIVDAYGKYDAAVASDPRATGNRSRGRR
jgi:phosphate starvation-inducible PhoH-like protein